MKLQDYIHYYIGCEMLYSSHHEPQNEPYILTFENIKESVEFGDRPILRKLEDITEEEMKSLVLIIFSVGNTLKSVEKINNTIQFKTSGFTGGGIIDLSELSSYQFHYLLKMKFDLFQLIENGLAIDSKTLK